MSPTTDAARGPRRKPSGAPRRPAATESSCKGTAKPRLVAPARHVLMPRREWLVARADQVPRAVGEAVTELLAGADTGQQSQPGGRLAKAIYFAAGETSTAVRSIAFAAAVAAAHIPGGKVLLMAMIGFNASPPSSPPPPPEATNAEAIRALRS